MDEHLKHLEIVFTLMKKYGVTCYEDVTLGKITMPLEPAKIPDDLRNAMNTRLTDDEMLFNPMKGLELPE